MLWRGPMGGGAASGRIGAMIASHCAQGQTLQIRSNRTNPASAFQHVPRNAMRRLPSIWASTLTPTQRLAWSVYAANTTVVNRLGDSVHISGIAMFCRSNVSRLQAGLSLITTAPTTFDLGDLGPAPTLTLSPSGMSATVLFDPTADWVASGSANHMLVYCSRPVSGAISYFGRQYRLAGVIPSSNTTGTATVAMPFASITNGPGQVFTGVRIARGDARLTTLARLAASPTPPVWRTVWTDQWIPPPAPLYSRPGWSNQGNVSFSGGTVTAGSLPWASGGLWIAAQTNSTLTGISGIATRAAITVAITPNADTTPATMSLYLGTSLRTAVDLNWSPGDATAGLLTSLVVYDDSGDTLTVNAIPFAPAVHHVLTVSWYAGLLQATVDGNLIASIPTGQPSDGGIYWVSSALDTSDQSLILSQPQVAVTP